MGRTGRSIGADWWRLGALPRRIRYTARARGSVAVNVDLRRYIPNVTIRAGAPNEPAVSCETHSVGSPPGGNRNPGTTELVAPQIRYSGAAAPATVVSACQWVHTPIRLPTTDRGYLFINHQPVHVESVQCPVIRLRTAGCRTLNELFRRSVCWLDATFDHKQGFAIGAYNVAGLKLHLRLHPLERVSRIGLALSSNCLPTRRRRWPCTPVLLGTPAQVRRTSASNCSWRALIHGE
jgi:hypothetical protein